MFDPATIRATATFEDPFQKPEGVAAVIVAGQITVKDNQLTGARASAICLRDNTRKP